MATTTKTKTKTKTKTTIDERPQRARPEPAVVDFRPLFESAPDAALVLAPDPPRFSIVAVSDAFLRRTSLARDELIGRALFEAFPDDPRAPGGNAKMAASLARVVTGRCADVVVAGRRAVNTPVFGAGGEVRYIVHRIDEIAASVSARAEAVAHVGSWWLDVENDERRWSDEAYAIYGLKKGSPLLREQILSRVHPDDLAFVEAESAHARVGAIDIEYRIVVEGELRWVRARAEAEPDAYGNRVGTVQDITDQKRVAEQLARSEAQLRALFEGTPDGIFVADAAGNFVDVNTAACRMLGFSKEELLRSNITRLVRPRELERQAQFKASLAELPAERSEWELLRKDGSYLAVEMSANQLANGQLQAIVRDVTERRRAAEELRFSEERLSSIVAASADAIISVDETLRIVLFNHGAEAIFGWSAGEVLGHPLDVLLPERLRAKHARELGVLTAAGAEGARPMRGSVRAAIIGLRKNGEEFPADASVSTVIVSGQPLMTVSLRDVTEQERVAQEERFLADVGAVLARTLDVAETAASIARLSLAVGDWCVLRGVEDVGMGRIVAARSSDEGKQEVARHLEHFALDYARPFLGRAALSSWTTTVIEAHTAAAREALTQNESHRRIVEALGLESLVELPLIVQGRLVGALVVVSADPHRQFKPHEVRLLEGLGQRAALALENARLYRLKKVAVEDRDSVLRIVAHDLRNPLSGILMTARLLEADGGDHGRNARYGGAITRAAQRMNHLIEDLLDIAKADAKALSLAQEPVDVGALLHEVVAADATLAAEAGVHLAADLTEGELPAIFADRERLLQVLENLVGNAIKFTPTGGRVVLAASCTGDTVTFVVEDTGAGIPPDALPFVFDRFWQAKRADRAGAGLGLAIAKAIVDAHGGEIGVSSVVGAGTAFRFTIPTCAAERIDCR